MEFDDKVTTYGIGIQFKRFFLGAGVKPTECLFGVSWPNNLVVIHIGPFSILIAKV